MRPLQIAVSVAAAATVAVAVAGAIAVVIAAAGLRRSQRCIRFCRLQDHCLFSRRRHQYRFRHRHLSPFRRCFRHRFYRRRHCLCFHRYAAIVSANAAISVATAAACCPCLRERRTVAVDAIVKSV
jgi:hypothetical protein